VKHSVSFILGGLFAFLALAGPLVRAQADSQPGEPGVLYLEGNVPGKVTATLKTSLTLFLQRDFLMTRAILKPGETIQVVGACPEGYLVKGTDHNNTVEGWIHSGDLPKEVDPALFVQARKNEDQRAAVAVAIVNKNVIAGMTPEEVEQAVGSPQQTSSRMADHSSALVWTFITYKEEPQYAYALDSLGRPQMQTYYVKIPLGQMVVSFENGVVSSVEQHASDPSHPGVVAN